MKALLEKIQSLGLKRFPISFWSYTNLTEHGEHMTEAEVESWLDAGFTVPQSPSFDPNNAEEKAHIIRLLDYAYERGMKLIVTDPRGYAKAGPDGKPTADYADGIRAVVADFGDHPALFGFHIGDEPEENFKEAFFECYRIQKEIAPHLHPFANLLPYFHWILERAGTDSWPNYLDEFAEKSNADLVGYDCYVQMNQGESGWDDYFRNLRFHRESALRNGVPFWNTILSVGHYKYRCPNQDDLRWQFNTSIVAGANGIAWFFYYMREPEHNYRMSPVDEHWNKTQTYYDIQRIQKSFHRRYGDLFNRLVSTRVTFYAKAYAEGNQFTPNELIMSVEGESGVPMVIGEFADIDGKRYAVFVNNSTTENERYTITFQKNTKIFCYDWNGKENDASTYSRLRTVPDNDGYPVHSSFLAPGQEIVFRVEVGE